VCDVHVLTRGDAGIKTGVKWCPACQAWLCEECRGRFDLRAIAAIKRAAGWS
jgi:hypothetical protein